MSQQFIERLTEIATWYEYNKGLIPKEDVAKQYEFMRKTCDCLLELFTWVAEDLKKLEDAKKSDRLWLPSNLSVKGDITRFG